MTIEAVPMYLPPHFEETRAEALHALMRAYPLATLVTLSSAGICANHIPLHLDCGPDGACVLRGHVARANPVWRDMAPGVEALAIFHGPQGYVTPSWYPAKREHGKVVPTWNYAVVHAHGPLRAIDDADWLRRQVEAITAQQEAPLAEPWAVSDAPADYVERMLGAIVGIEMNVTRLTGKWKLSQNHPAPAREGVARGLAAHGEAELAGLVEQTSREGR